MSPRKRGAGNPLSALVARFERLDRALDEALTGSEYPPRPRRKKNAEPPAPVGSPLGYAASLIISALSVALLRDPDGLGELDYHRLKRQCNLGDEVFGLALVELIPSHLRTRSDGHTRYYFLRRDLRRAILMKTKLLKRVA